MNKRLEIKPEDKAKVAAFQNKQQSKVKVEPEHLIIAEFGKHYGWGGVKAILNNEIDSETVTWLLAAARKIDRVTLYDRSRASFIGAVSGNSKNPTQAFKKMTSNIVKEMKTDER